MGDEPKIGARVRGADRGGRQRAAGSVGQSSQGAAACQKGHSVALTTAAALVHELMEARNERRLRTLQKHLNTVKLLIVDELGYVPFTAVGSELPFEVFTQRYERAATFVTSNLPFDEWTTVFGI